MSRAVLIRSLDRLIDFVLDLRLGPVRLPARWIETDGKKTFFWLPQKFREGKIQQNVIDRYKESLKIKILIKSENLSLEKDPKKTFSE